MKMRRDECGESIIPGRQGQIYEYGDGELGVMFMPPPTEDEPQGRWRPKTWNNFRKAALAKSRTTPACKSKTLIAVRVKTTPV